MTLGWREPAHPFATSSCYCGDPECRRCYPHRQIMVAVCSECRRVQHEDRNICEECGESMEDAMVRPSRRDDFDPS